MLQTPNSTSNLCNGYLFYVTPLVTDTRCRETVSRTALAAAAHFSLCTRQDHYGTEITIKMWDRELGNFNSACMAIATPRTGTLV